jgi:hypothetical protein
LALLIREDVLAEATLTVEPYGLLTARRRRRLGLVVRALDFLSGPERIVRGQRRVGFIAQEMSS